jgi:hypothetical protein
MRRILSSEIYPSLTATMSYEFYMIAFSIILSLKIHAFFRTNYSLSNEWCFIMGALELLIIDRVFIFYKRAMR